MVDFGKAFEESSDRGRFGSRLAFYMAAVGSAVGFGNVWRFPSLCAEYGGAAFLIPYILSLVFIGIPVMFLEVGFGQYHQTGDAGVFGSFNKRLRGIGLCSVVAGFTLLCYYNMLISWVMNAFFQSFKSDNPWVDEDLDGDKGTGYFFQNVVGMNTVGEDSLPTRLTGANAGYSVLTWFITWAAIAFGPKITGRITYFTMGFPILLLFIFLFRSISLEGASEGINIYVGSKTDLTVLSSKPDVWTVAVTQIFFSLSVTIGVMTAYGSMVPRSEPAFFNSVIIACSNCTFSFIAGFAVFSCIGHLAFLKGVGVSEIQFKSFSLVFGTWPVTLGSLNGGVHWIRFLFLNLILLGIDSAFSILEGLITVLMDSTYFKDTPKWKVTLVVAVLGYFVSLLYATDAGLFFLDTVDYYINFMLLFVGFLQTFSAGWMYGLDRQIEKVGEKSAYFFILANFVSTLIAAILWFYAGTIWGGFLALILIYGFFLAAATATLKTDSKSEGLHVIFWQNVLDLRKELTPVIGLVPYAWCFLIKHFIPQILLILFINGTAAENDKGQSIFGHYGGYPTRPYQALGIFFFILLFFTFLIGVFFPSVYSSFAIYENSGKTSVEKIEEVAEKEVEEAA